MRALIVVAAAAGAIAAAFGLSRYAEQRWWGVALAAWSLGVFTAATIVVSHVRTRDAFSPLALTAIFYFASFAAGGVYYWIVRDPQLTRIAPVYDEGDVVSALILALISFAAIVVGYIVNPSRAVVRRLPALPRFESTTQRVSIVATLLAIGWIARLEQLATGTYFHVGTGEATTTTGASWFVMAASQLPTVAAAFVGAQAFLTRRYGNRSIRAELLFYALLCAEVAWYTPVGSRGALLTLLLMFAVVRYYGLGKRPSWLGIAIAVAFAIFVVFPLELGYRESHGGYQREPATQLKESLNQILEQNPAEAWDNGFNATFTRLSSITSVATILHAGRDVLDRGSGRTLLWAAETPIPRAVYPDKFDPGLFGNEFGRAYRLLPADNTQTSIAITQFGEFYLDWGVVGMVVGMCVVGALYCLVGDYFAGRRSDPLVLAVYAVVAWDLVNLQESIVAVGLFGLIKLMLFLVLVLGAASAIQRKVGSVGFAPAGRGLARPQ